MVLGQRIKELRKGAGWSQGELGERIGTDSQRVSRYENGRITPSVDALVRIAEALESPSTPAHRRQPTPAPARRRRRPRRPPRRPRHLSDDDRAALLHMRDALVTKNRLKALAGERS
ncbi:MAG: helix-turn-helix domain-containing protein [Anaerolineales bacterium]